MNLNDIFAKSKMASGKVIEIIKSLTYDPVWTDDLIRRLEAGETDIRPVLHYIASTCFAPSQFVFYLETGVRRGWSMACVSAAAPGCYLLGFDAWIENYGGVGNPGLDFVESELLRLGHKGVISLVDGDTNVTLPQVLNEFSESVFQKLFRLGLILVDGDHSYQGALNDLTTLIPKLEPGGYLVIDDLLPLGFDLSKTLHMPRTLEAEAVTKAWAKAQRLFPDLIYAQEGQVGIAYKPTSEQPV